MGLGHVPLWKLWNSKESMIQNLTGLNAARGLENPDKIAKETFAHILKAYPTDSLTEEDLIRMTCRFMGDGGFYGGFIRAETLDSDVWCYELSVKTKMLFEEPYKNGNTVVDPSWSSATHMTDLLYMFGYPLMKNEKFPG